MEQAPWTFEEPTSQDKINAIASTPAGLRQIKTNYVTAVAVQKPRNLAEVKQRFLQECMFLGEDGFYGWGVGQDKVEGPSVQFAMALVRCWRNVVIEATVFEETPTAFNYVSTLIDLEDGTTISRPFRQSRNWKVYGKLDEERKEHNRHQIGVSKSHRNVILSAMPAWLVNEGLQICKEAGGKKLDEFIKAKGIAAARQMVVEGLLKAGAKKEQILAKVERENLEDLTRDDILALRGDLRALRSGEESVASIFPKIEDASTEKAELSKAQKVQAELNKKKEENSPKAKATKELLEAIVGRSLDVEGVNAFIAESYENRTMDGLTEKELKDVTVAINEGLVATWIEDQSLANVNK